MRVIGSTNHRAELIRSSVDAYHKIPVVVIAWVLVVFAAVDITLETLNPRTRSGVLSTLGGRRGPSSRRVGSLVL